MIGILSCLCFVECCCLFIFKACSGLNRKCSLSELSAPHLLNHRRNMLTLYYLQVSLSSHISRIHQNFVFMGHQHHYMQTGWQGIAADRHIVCISSAHVIFSLSHQPHSQNTSVEKKSLIISRQQQQNFKSRVRPV